MIFNEEENAVQRYCKENDISDEDMEDTFGKWQTIAPMTLTTLEKNPFIQVGELFFLVSHDCTRTRPEIQ